MTRLTLIISAVALASAGCASTTEESQPVAAAPEAPQSVDTESTMDRWRRQGRRMNFIADHDHDNDSRVSTIEFETSRRSRFDATDTNSDGVVEEQEYVYEWEDRMDAQLEKDRSGRAKQTYVRFAAMDKDDDERMAWEEYAASGNRIFVRYDTNEDGVIDASDPAPSYNWTPKPDSELTAEELQKRRDRQMSYARSMLEMPTTHNLEGVMVRYDLDGDERVERAEFDGKRRADYDATDFDGDGTLIADEYASEFEDRMDEAIEKFRAKSIKQASKRFNALDDNQDGVMTFAEYRQSGNRIFARYDGSHDGYVNLDDPMPPRWGSAPKTQTQTQVASNGSD